MPRLQHHVFVFMMLMALIWICQHDTGRPEPGLDFVKFVLLLALLHAILSLRGPAANSYPSVDSYAIRRPLTDDPNILGPRIMERGQTLCHDDNLPHPIPEVGEDPPVRIHHDPHTDFTDGNEEHPPDHEYNINQALPPTMFSDEHTSNNSHNNRPDTDPGDSDLPYPIPESGDHPLYQPLDGYFTRQGSERNSSHGSTSVNYTERGNRSRRSRRRRGAFREANFHSGHGVLHSPTPRTGRSARTRRQVMSLPGIIPLLALLFVGATVRINEPVWNHQPSSTRPFFGHETMQRLQQRPQPVPPSSQRMGAYGHCCGGLPFPIQEPENVDQLPLRRNHSNADIQSIGRQPVRRNCAPPRNPSEPSQFRYGSPERTGDTGCRCDDLLPLIPETGDVVRIHLRRNRSNAGVQPLGRHPVRRTRLPSNPRSPSRSLYLLPERIGYTGRRCECLPFPIQETGDVDRIPLRRNRSNAGVRPIGHESVRRNRPPRNPRPPSRFLYLTPARASAHREQTSSNQGGDIPFPIQETGNVDLVRLHQGSALNVRPNGSGLVSRLRPQCQAPPPSLTSNPTNTPTDRLVDGTPRQRRGSPQFICSCRRLGREGRVFDPNENTSRHPGPGAGNGNHLERPEKLEDRDQWALFTVVLVTTVFFTILLYILFTVTTDDTRGLGR